MPMTMKQIYNRTPRMRKIASLYVKITHIKLGRNRQGLPFAASQSYSAHHILPTGRVIRVRAKIKYVTTLVVISKRGHCKVSCSCPDFTFAGWEYSLAERGAADIEYGNGAAPDIKNPSQVPGACKHVIALYLKVAPKLGI